MPYTPTRKAFSLVELLVTLSIIAILGVIAVNFYNGINNSAMAVAQQKDQAELNQVMGMLHASGGNILAIVSPAQNEAILSQATPASSPIQAQAFSQLLQGNNITAQSQTQKGSIGNSLPTSEMIVPYGYPDYTNYGNPPNPTYDGKPRIVFSSTGVPSIVTPKTPATATPGFIVVNVNSNEGKAFTAFLSSRAASTVIYSATKLINNPSTSANPGAANSNLNGSKYAAANAYVWDEDPVPVAPTTVPAGPTPTPTLLPQIDFAFAFSPSANATTALPDGNTVPNGSYHFADYTRTSAWNGRVTWKSDPTVYVFAYNATSGADLPAGSITLKAQFGGANITLTPIGTYPANSTQVQAYFGNSALSSLGSQEGLLASITGLNSVQPPLNWNSTSMPMAVSVTSSNAIGSSYKPVSIYPIPLDPPEFSTTTSVNPGGTVDVTTDQSAYGAVGNPGDFSSDDLTGDTQIANGWEYTDG
jgi:prepilin-type N-terminal cleavage/methylation domain-containing protein